MDAKVRNKNLAGGPFQKPSLGVAILILTIFGVAALVAYNVWNRIVADAIRSNDIKAGLIANVIVEHEKATIGVLRSFVARPSFIEAFKNRNMQETLRDFETFVKNNDEIEIILVADPGGTLWVNYPIYRESWNKNFSYRDWYKGVSEKWRPYVSCIYKMVIGEKDLCISVCVPVFDENEKVIGILNASQKTGFFQKVIHKIGLDVNSKITLIDQEGQIIYSNRFPYQKEVVKYTAFPFVKNALAGQKGKAEVRDSSDEEKTKFVSFAPVEGHGWSVIVEKAKGDIFYDNYGVFVVIALISCLSGMMILISGSFFRQKQRQISQLAKLNQQLDTRVKERTAELEKANEELQKEVEQRQETDRGLRESEERLRLALDTAGMASWDWDLRTGNIIWNERHYLMFGYQPGELNSSYEAWAKRVHPADLPAIEARMRQKAEECGEYNSEYRTFWADGTERWVEARGRFQNDEAGKAIRSYGVLLEITERKRAEEETKKLLKAVIEEKNRLSALIDSIADEIWLSDINRTIIMANPSVLREFGLAPGNLPELKSLIQSLEIYRPDGSLRPPDEAPGLRALNGEVIRNLEEIIRTPATGKLRYRQANSAPVKDAEGNIIGSVTVVRDITESKQAEKALRESEERFRHYFELGLIGMAITSPAKGWIEVNDEICKILGYERGELLQKTWTELTHPDDLASDVAQFNRVMKGEIDCYSIDKRFFRKDGQVIYTSISVRARRREDGSIDYFLALIQDITERRRAEEALQQRSLELQHLTETLEGRVKERTAELAMLSHELLVAQEKERKRISYDLHDHIWQTLVAIRSEIERLFSTPGETGWPALHDKAKHVMAAILDAVGKIRSMQGDLWPYVLDDIGILATIDWYCREFEKNHTGIGIERKVSVAEYEIPPPIKMVIYRAMQEALNNVAQHSRASRVILRLIKTDHCIELAVQDDGIGFDPEETIFKRTPWAGLGLLTIKGRTEASGGILAIESVKGKGTTVRASWPLHGNG